MARSPAVTRVTLGDWSGDGAAQPAAAAAQIHTDRGRSCHPAGIPDQNKVLFRQFLINM